MEAQWIDCVQETGFITLQIMSRPGRITMAGHIMTIVRNLLGDEAANQVGRIRLLQENNLEVSIQYGFRQTCLGPLGFCMLPAGSCDTAGMHVKDQDGPAVQSSSKLQHCSICCSGFSSSLWFYELQVL